MLQGILQFVQVVPLQQLATVEHHLWLLQHIHIGEAQLQGGAIRPEALDGGQRRMQSGHACRVEADPIGLDAVDGGQPLSHRCAGRVSHRW